MRNTQKMFLLSLIMLLLSCPAFADKSSVRIEAPDHAAIGDEIKIILHITHRGNNIFHHTNWVVLNINGKEIERREFGMFSLPESESFTWEIAYVVKEAFTISAQANCNIHGSAGIAEEPVEAR